MNGFLWERFVTDGKLNDEFRRASGVLAALRRGARQEPGTEPAMWPYYSKLDEQGRLTPDLQAEHICLVTYGTHQQGVAHSVHQSKRGIGQALHDLRFASTFSPEAIDGHVNRFATASQPAELCTHLLSLVNLMKATKRPIGFDYTTLYHDLVALQKELQAGRVRRRWGAAYFRPASENQIKE